MYPPESVIAEKLQAMIALDIRNSRMKDFYDVWYLARHWSFQLAGLRRAALATFERRRTAMPTGLPFALTDEFLTDVGKRLDLPAKTPELLQIGQEIASFVHPIFEPGEDQAIGQPGGPWRS